VIPNTLFGLLLFAASIGPGYIYVRVAERYRPRPERSALLETAELVSVGGLASSLALLAGLLVAETTGWLNLEAFANGGTKYVLTHPARGLTFVLAVLLASYVGTWKVAERFHRDLPAAITTNPIWHEVLGDQAATRYVYATVELRDGRFMYGGVERYTLDEASPENKELVLTQPLKAKASARSEWAEVKDDSIVLSARDITTIGLKYAAVPPALRAPAKAGT
jgi:hypothetical protein